MATITEEQIAEAKIKAKDVTLLEASGEEVLARPATRAEWKKHMSALTNEETRSIAFDALFFDCVVFPPRAELNAMLERQPGLSLTFAKQIQKLSGLTSEVSAKKV